MLTEPGALSLPGTILTVDVAIDDSGDALVPGSAKLNYRLDGGAFVQLALNPIGGGVYRATLPALTCADTPQFFVEAQGAVSGLLTDPGDAPASTYGTEIGEFIEIFTDSFDANLGWTVQNSTSPALTDGPWERAVPTACPSGARGEPGQDAEPTGGGWAYVTDNSTASACNSDVDGGYTWLISPTIDLSSGDADVYYALWYTNNAGGAPNADTFVVAVSNNNGASWTTAATYGPTTSDGWNFYSFRVGDFVTPNSQVRVRFEASDLATGSVVEAGVDAFIVRRFQCIDAPAGCDGDMNCDGQVNFGDIDRFVEALGFPGGAGWPYPDCPWSNGDVNGDNTVNFSDIDGFVSLIGTACP